MFLKKYQIIGAFFFGVLLGLFWFMHTEKQICIYTHTMCT